MGFQKCGKCYNISCNFLLLAKFFASLGLSEQWEHAQGVQIGFTRRQKNTNTKETLQTPEGLIGRCFDVSRL